MSERKVISILEAVAEAVHERIIMELGEAFGAGYEAGQKADHYESALSDFLGCVDVEDDDED